MSSEKRPSFVPINNLSFKKSAQLTLKLDRQSREALKAGFRDEVEVETVIGAGGGGGVTFPAKPDPPLDSSVSDAVRLEL